MVVLYGETLRDTGKGPAVLDISRSAMENSAYRLSFWTGEHLQMTLMSLEPREEIGLEMHPDVDQYLRVEEGDAIVHLGKTQLAPDSSYRLTKDWAAFIPAGIWHNVINISSQPLKLSSVYAPPQHPFASIQQEKE